MTDHFRIGHDFVDYGARDILAKGAPHELDALFLFLDEGPFGHLERGRASFDGVFKSHAFADEPEGRRTEDGGGEETASLESQRDKTEAEHPQAEQEEER